MQTAQRLDVLLPDIVEKLDPGSLAHRSLQSFDKPLWAVMARYRLASLRAQHPRVGLRLDRRGRSATRLSHAGLLSVIKGKPEGVAKGGKRSLGGPPNSFRRRRDQTSGSCSWKVDPKKLQPAPYAVIAPPPLSVGG